LKEFRSFGKKILTSKYLKVVIVLLIFAFLLRAGYDKWRDSQPIDYAKDKNEAVATIDGKPVTLGDMAYLIMLEERRTEEQARVYNPASPKDYWNTSDKGKILSIRIRNTALDMCIHDKIMYERATKAGVELNAEEKETVKNAQTDFWEDLFDGQEENAYVSKETINRQIYKAAVVTKYQRILAKKAKINQARYGYEGDKYKEILEDYKVKVNKTLLRKIRMGEVTLLHDTVNFVQ
jgi:hypothetical protein